MMTLETDPDPSFLDAHRRVLMRAAGLETDSAEALLAELWALRSAESEGELGAPAAARLGEECAARGLQPETVVKVVLTLGRGLVEAAIRTRELDLSAARRLDINVDRAAVLAAAAFRRATDDRRDAWLSFLTHDLKNPLNTVFNALWLLRERGGDKDQAGRFLDLAERAAKRMEELVRQIRHVEERLGQDPPNLRSYARVVAPR
jgi:signal transduction histidine kinase